MFKKIYIYKHNITALSNYMYNTGGSACERSCSSLLLDSSCCHINTINKLVQSNDNETKIACVCLVDEVILQTYIYIYIYIYAV
jgi:hypothetical protein